MRQYRRGRHGHQSGLSILRLYLQAGNGRAPSTAPDRNIDPPWSWKGHRGIYAEDLAITVPIAEPRIRYKVFASVGWNTNIWYSGKTLTSFVLNFSTPAPSDGIVDFAVLSYTLATSPRQEIQAVTLDATSVTITFETAQVDTDYQILGTPNWNTAWWYSSKATASIVINFQTPAPADALFDWVSPA